MAFYTGSSLYHTVKSSSSSQSDTSDESVSSSTHSNTPALPPCVAHTTRMDKAIMTDVKPARKQEPKRESFESASPTVSPSPGPSSPTVKPPPRKTTESEREVIMTMTLNGKTPREIAESLGLKANTVAKFIERRKKKAINSMGSEVAQLLARSPPKKR